MPSFPLNISVILEVMVGFMEGILEVNIPTPPLSHLFFFFLTEA